MTDFPKDAKGADPKLSFAGVLAEYCNNSVAFEPNGWPIFAKGPKTLAFCPGVANCEEDSAGFDCICPKLNFGGSMCGVEEVVNAFDGACAAVCEGAWKVD